MTALRGWTVQELIAHLEKFPSNMMVVVRSYETGYDPVSDVTELHVHSVDNPNWWDGLYDDASSGGEKVLFIRFEG